MSILGNGPQAERAYGLGRAERCTPDYEAAVADLDKKVAGLTKFIEGVDAMEEVDGRPCDELCAAYGKAILINRGFARARISLMNEWEKSDKDKK